MISKNLDAKHIYNAIEEIQKIGIPKDRHSTKYDLIVEEVRYPPKYVISIAHKYLINRQLLPSEFDAVAAKKHLKRIGFTVIRKNSGIDSIPLKNRSTSSDYFDEYGQITGIFEGALKRVSVNKYERSAQARSICLNQYGYQCKVCEFDFEKTYGEIGKEFIHVHHIVDIAAINKEYIVDPINDLIPVCPNCHAMLHKNGPFAFTVNELKEIINEQKI